MVHRIDFSLPTQQLDVKCDAVQNRKKESAKARIFEWMYGIKLSVKF